MTTRYWLLATVIIAGCIALAMRDRFSTIVSTAATLFGIATLVHALSLTFSLQSTRKWLLISTIPTLILSSLTIVAFSQTQNPAAINIAIGIAGGVFWLAVAYAIVEGAFARFDRNQMRK
jgi:hypothetical protein